MDCGRKMRMGAFLYPTGHHLAAWRHPNSTADAGMNIGHYIEMAQLAGRGYSICSSSLTTLRLGREKRAQSVNSHTCLGSNHSP